MRAPRVSIDLEALRHNFELARQRAGKARVMAVVKADAYGHGMLRVALSLDAADAFAVSCVAEAAALREAGITQPLVALHGFRDEEDLMLACARNVQLALHQEYQLHLLERARLARPLRVWVKLDTGMHRLGFPPERAHDIVASLQGLANVDGKPVLMTHLAAADEMEKPETAAQIAAFEAASAGLALERSLANSAGLLGWPQAHGDWVRPGLMLYGASPFAGRCGADEGLRPVMRLQAPVVAVTPRRRGDPIGYGGDWRCQQDCWIAVVAIGYGDGYPRHACSGTPVLIRGRRCPIVGRVSMDLITVDLGAQPIAAPGDHAVLWGPELPVEEVARHATTLGYELLCGVGIRVRSETVASAGSASGRSGGGNY